MNTTISLPRACILSAIALATPFSHADDAAAILALAREALQLAQRPASGIQATGTADFRGEEVPFTFTFDNQGRFHAQLAGDLPLTMAYDGTQSWERDWNATERFTVLGDRDGTLISNWTVTGDWAAEHSQLNFTEPPTQPNSQPDSQSNPADSITLDFTLDNSPMTGTVELDPATHLPRRFTWTSGHTSTTQELSGFGDLAGAMIPSRIHQTSTSGNPITILFSTAGPSPTFVRSPYAPAFSRAADTAFDPAIPAALEVKRAPTGHLLVHPLVGGKDIGWFIFDSGAGTNVLSSPVADEAGFERFGSIKAVGVGGATDAHFYRAPALSLGPITITEPVFVGIDLAFLDQYMGVRIGGVIGYELLARTIVEFDITGAQIALHDPAIYRSDAPWHELLLYQRHPCIRATFEGHEGIFNLDTGAAQSTVTFHHPATQRLGLLDGRETSASTIGGVGGNVPAREGLIKSFDLGGRRSENITATFATEPIGAFADAYLAGNIGGQLMAPFNLILDYPSRRIAFIPRPQDPTTEP
jgi:predicted aspartyl protease